MLGNLARKSDGASWLVCKRCLTCPCFAIGVARLGKRVMGYAAIQAIQPVMLSVPELSKYSNRTKRAWFFPETQEKICAKCGKMSHVENFFKHGQTKDGYHSWCKSCCKEGNLRSRLKRYSTFEGRVSTFLSTCRHSSIKRGQECTITREDLMNAWEQQGGICVYTGLEMTTAPNENHSVSVERIDNEVGYTPENTVLVCNIVNQMKSNIPGEVFYEFCRLVVEHLGDESGRLDVDFRKE